MWELLLAGEFPQVKSGRMFAGWNHRVLLAAQEIDMQGITWTAYIINRSWISGCRGIEYVAACQPPQCMKTAGDKATPAHPA